MTSYRIVSHEDHDPAPIIRLWSLCKTRRMWSLLMALTAAGRGTSYLFTTPANSDALRVLMSFFPMSHWGFLICVGAVGLLLGLVWRPVAFAAHLAMCGLYLALGVGLIAQAATSLTPWGTGCGYVLAACFHVSVGLWAMYQDPPLRVRQRLARRQRGVTAVRA